MGGSLTDRAIPSNFVIKLSLDPQTLQIYMLGLVSKKINNIIIGHMGDFTQGGE